MQAESQHFKLGKSQKLKSFTWDGVTYTKWKVFYTEDTIPVNISTSCIIRHTKSLFDGNGGNRHGIRKDG
jgi:hypothetical protein